MKSLEFIGTIVSGKICPPSGFIAFMRAQDNKKFKVTLSENLTKRSLNQNSYYWTVIVPKVREFRIDNGDTVSIEQTHEDLLMEFSPQVKCNLFNNRVRMRPKRSKEMNKYEMTDYIEAITARLAEFGYPIKLEGEYYDTQST